MLFRIIKAISHLHIVGYIELNQELPIFLAMSSESQEVSPISKSTPSLLCCPPPLKTEIPSLNLKSTTIQDTVFFFHFQLYYVTVIFKIYRKSKSTVSSKQMNFFISTTP